MLVNPNYSGAQGQLREVQEAAARLGVQLVIVRANVETDFDAAFSTLVQQRATALLVNNTADFGPCDSKAWSRLAMASDRDMMEG